MLCKLQLSMFAAVAVVNATVVINNVAVAVVNAGAVAANQWCCSCGCC